MKITPSMGKDVYEINPEKINLFVRGSSGIYKKNLKIDLVSLYNKLMIKTICSSIIQKQNESISFILRIQNLFTIYFIITNSQLSH